MVAGRAGPGIVDLPWNVGPGLLWPAGAQFRSVGISSWLQSYRSPVEVLFW